MPIPTRSRPSITALVALMIGALLLVAGVASAASLGPQGRVSASVTTSTGVMVIGREALGASTTAPRLGVTGGRGTVTVLHLLEQDAAAVTEGVRHARVTGVSVLSRALTVTEDGEDRFGPPNADLYRQEPATGERVETGPLERAGVQAVVALAGTPGDVREEPVTVTLTWENAAWFWQLLAIAAVGMSLTAWAAWSWWRAERVVGASSVRQTREVPA